MHDDIPITGYHRGEPIPDLCRLPGQRWREVLKPLCPVTRRRAVRQRGHTGRCRGGAALVGLLMVEDPPPGDLPPATPLRFYGLRPGTFARLLTVRGVDAALYEKRRAG
ncbi:MAG: hypothetical protein Q8K79_16085 [Solirubrobacteraceae bacterium]|nr:hypothetical protein [Solirubrobacteraceae bacterium]